MYQGRHVTQRDSSKAVRNKRRRYRGKRPVMLILALALIAAMAIGGTIAYLTTKTDGVVNTFTPSKVSCTVEEDFNGTTKEKVNVRNTGDTTAYIRVKLVTYRTNDAGQHIGGTASTPNFSPGADWVLYDGYYYYTKPVAPEEKPEADLISSITLESYTDVDGGHQAIDVMAEAIQSEPARAVGQAWGVSISPGSVTAYSGN